MGLDGAGWGPLPDVGLHDGLVVTDGLHEEQLEAPLLHHSPGRGEGGGAYKGEQIITAHNIAHQRIYVYITHQVLAQHSYGHTIDKIQTLGKAANFDL